MGTLKKLGGYFDNSRSGIDICISNLCSEVAAISFQRKLKMAIVSLIPHKKFYFMEQSTTEIRAMGKIINLIGASEGSKQLPIRKADFRQRSFL